MATDDAPSPIRAQAEGRARIGGRQPAKPAGWGHLFKFTGKEEDIEVGATYFGARYYHARLGRWMSADPLTIHGLDADPNPYAYVGGRVMSHIDPFGLDPIPAGLKDVQQYAESGLWSGYRADGSLEVGLIEDAPTSDRAGDSRDPTVLSAGNVVRGTAHVPVPFTGGGYVIPNQVRRETVNAATKTVLEDSTALGLAIPGAGDAVAVATGGNGDPNNISGLAARAGVFIAAIVGGGAAAGGSGPARAVAPCSRVLGRALETAGHARPPSSAAHHIVAGIARSAAPARAVLQRFGIGINEAGNGVFLQQGVHSGIHTSAYYQAVNEMLGQVTSRREALEALDAIRKGLLAGGFP